MSINIDKFRQICERNSSEVNSAAINFYNDSKYELEIRMRFFDRFQLNDLIAECENQNVDFYLAGDADQALFVVLDQIPQQVIKFEFGGN